ncbi:Sporulation protein cse60 [compost metagenome]
MISSGDDMKVKLFDENHEKDLEKAINTFLSENAVKVVDIKYSVAFAINGEEQIYCFSALLLYEKG